MGLAKNGENPLRHGTKMCRATSPVAGAPKEARVCARLIYGALFKRPSLLVPLRRERSSVSSSPFPHRERGRGTAAPPKCGVAVEGVFFR